MIPRIIGANRPLGETAPPWTGTESARLAPKCIASRPASTDMQDSGVDGPHTTGMHRTSYRLPYSAPPDRLDYDRNLSLSLLVIIRIRGTNIKLRNFSERSSVFFGYVMRDILTYGMTWKKHTPVGRKLPLFEITKTAFNKAEYEAFDLIALHSHPIFETPSTIFEKWPSSLSRAISVCPFARLVQ
ncbi:hypothetical protein DBV15_07918 [Temnothorax longispinosus]|uniref:Uncharacterized protein n=1 Tax=Temnothorax longispinosus TaxID=300112 RepID=A0A4S2JR58_9HYME|nr:hypothetical protein DBV15_07918 [Temnothorax longispinosus]